MPNQQFLTIDVGSAWTKAFLVNFADNYVNVEKSVKLPTSWGDLSFSVNLLLSQILQKDVTKIFISNLPEVEKIAEKNGGQFVREDTAATNLVRYFKVSNSGFIILDAGASNFKQPFLIEDVGKYLTFQANSIFLENFIGKKRYQAHVLPVDTKELEIEEAFLRSIFKAKLSGRSSGKQNIIALSGGVISGTPKLSRVALILLDIHERMDVSQVLFDREFFLPSFGALLSTYKQLQTANVGPWLENMGTLVSLGGKMAADLDWDYSQIQKIELEEGEISLVPVPKEQKIKLSLVTSEKNKSLYEVGGGTLGLVFDARIKPLPIAYGQNESRKLMTDWLKQVEEAELSKEVF